VRINYWSIRSTACPEAYIHLAIEPGQEFTWKIAYEFIRPGRACRRACATVLLLNCSFGLAQAPGQLPEFEVAAIKPNKTNERMYYGLRNGNLTVRNMSVKGLIQAAYGKRDFQIIGGPGWISSECFDIDAKAERSQKRARTC